MTNRLQLLLTQYVEAQQETNRNLEKIAALIISNQLLQECVDHNGQTRAAEDVAVLISESFSAGLCLLGELEQRNKDFDYQKSEFFVDEPDDSDGDNSLSSF